MRFKVVFDNEADLISLAWWEIEGGVTTIVLNATAILALSFIITTSYFTAAWLYS